MRICIHRGTEQIGGTCIEIEALGRRVVLDVGMPLDVTPEQAESALPQVHGFREPADDLSLLAPDIVERILAGRQPITLTVESLRAPPPLDWNDQRKAFGIAHK